MSKERFKIIPAVYLILQKDNQILLLRRYNTGYEDGNYSLPAGHVDGNESFTQAMIREAYEEAGIRLKPEDVEVAHIQHRCCEDLSNERVDVFIKAYSWEGELVNKEPYKCDDLSWFDHNNLPENIIPYIRQAIENVLKNNFYSEHGWN